MQGQETLAFPDPYNTVDLPNSRLTEVRKSVVLGSPASFPFRNLDASYKSTGFGESAGFREVLQGQEICSLRSSLGDVRGARTRDSSGRLGFFDGFNMFAAGNRWAKQAPPPTSSAQVSSPSSVLMFQQATAAASYAYSSCNSNTMSNMIKKDQFGVSNCSDVAKAQYGPAKSGCFRQIRNDFGNVLNYNLPIAPGPREIAKCEADDKGSPGENLTAKSACKLFGFSLLDESHAPNEGRRSQISSALMTDKSLAPLHQHSGWELPGTQHESETHPSKTSSGRSCTKV